MGDKVSDTDAKKVKETNKQPMSLTWDTAVLASEGVLHSVGLAVGSVDGTNEHVVAIMCEYYLN